MMQSKKCQTGLTVLFVLLVIGLFWITGLAPMLTAAGEQAVLNGETGLSALFYTHLNLLVGLVWLAAIAFTIKVGF